MASSSSSHSKKVELKPFCEIGATSKRENQCVSAKLYDVFINHRGSDVKESLALPLYNSLQDLGLRPFLDSRELELGDSFPPILENAIFSASVHVAIFSKGYAESPWCLAELTRMKKSEAEIIPVFYNVTPSDLRHVKEGYGVYAKAFVKYEEKGRCLENLEDWKETLKAVSFINGCEFGKYNGNHQKLCEDIAAAVLKEVEKTKSLYVAEHPVGLNELIKDFEECVRRGEEKVNIIGIFGMGGSGKTTLAIELFNRKRRRYNGSCFLYDVREASKSKSGLHSLQSKLLKDLVHENITFDSVPEGSNHLRSRLQSGRFLKYLIVLDDIDDLNQLNALVVGDILNSSSLVIVTTRDEGLLIRAQITVRYRMKEMNIIHGRELFCWHAFRQSNPTVLFRDLVEEFVKACGGLPLSLKVLGGHVSRSNDKLYWKRELDKVRKILPTDIKQILQISIDALDREQKQIFIDIACFFTNKSKSTAVRIWDGSGWSAEHSLQILEDKCLVEVKLGSSYWNGLDLGIIPLLRMHDHLRELGREMADELSHPRRLWRPRDLQPLESKGFENILAETRGQSLRCFNSIFDPYTRTEFRYFLGNSDGDCVETPTSLLGLEVDMSVLENLEEEEIASMNPLSWIIPSWIPLQNLQYLKIYNGRLQGLWQCNEQIPFQLKELLLDGTTLEEFPTSLEMLNRLEDLVLIGRVKWNGGEWNNPVLIKGSLFSESITKLTNLRSLVMRDLTVTGDLSLNKIGKSPMDRLERMDIRDLKLVSKISISEEHCSSLKSFHLDHMIDLIEVDFTQVEAHHSVERITIDGCWKLQSIRGLDKFKGLKYLHLSADNRAIQSCIQRLQRLPSECTSVIGRAVIGIQSSLNIDFFSGVIGREAVTEIPFHPQKKTVFPLSTQVSAIILCILVSSFEEGEDSRKDLKIPCMEWMTSYITKGEWMVTIVVTDQEKIKKMLYDMSPWIPAVSNGEIKKGFIVTVNKDQAKKHPHIFRKIVSELYGCGIFKYLHLDKTTTNQTEVDLPQLVAQYSLELLGISSEGEELASVEEEGSSEEEELASVGSLSGIEKITIDGCWELQDIKGIEKFEGLKYLHLSTHWKAIDRCLWRLKRRPSRGTTLIWREPDFQELLDDRFVWKISLLLSQYGEGFPRTVYVDSEEKIMVPLNSRVSELMFCVLVERFDEGEDSQTNIKIGGMNWMVSGMTKGKWIVIIVVSDQEKIEEMVVATQLPDLGEIVQYLPLTPLPWIPIESYWRERFMSEIAAGKDQKYVLCDVSPWIPVVSHSKIMKGFIGAAEKGQQMRLIN